MPPNFKLAITLGHAVACTASCSLLAPQDSELLRRDDPGDAAALPADTGQDGPAAAPFDSSREALADGGAEGSDPCASLACPENSLCRERQGVGSCACSPGFLGSPGSCRRAISCDELHAAEPELASGVYTLLPLGSATEIPTYCEMRAEGGGWTLILNQGPSFDPQAHGVQALIIQTDSGPGGDGPADAGQGKDGGADAGETDVCFDEECVSPAYSSVRLRSDVMLDMSDGPISADNYSARVIITEIGLPGRGKTLRELFTTGPYFLDRDDNSNVTVRVRSGLTCAAALPFDMGNVLCNPCRGEGSCGQTVLVFGDSDSGCAGAEPVHFAIGAAYSQTEPWGQCAGWPQDPNYGDYNFFPDNYRIWLR